MREKKKAEDQEQAWFWTKRWQQGEKEAEADIRAGRVKIFPDAVNFISLGDKISFLTHHGTNKQEGHGQTRDKTK